MMSTAMSCIRCSRSSGVSAAISSACFLRRSSISLRRSSRAARFSSSLRLASSRSCSSSHGVFVWIDARSTGLPPGWPKVVTSAQLVVAGLIQSGSSASRPDLASVTIWFSRSIARHSKPSNSWPSKRK